MHNVWAWGNLSGNTHYLTEKWPTAGLTHQLMIVTTAAVLWKACGVHWTMNRRTCPEIRRERDRAQAQWSACVPLIDKSRILPPCPYKECLPALTFPQLSASVRSGSPSPDLRAPTPQNITFSLSMYALFLESTSKHSCKLDVISKVVLLVR